MLIQLTYASRTSRVLGPADIKDILSASQRNNARAGITGALCLNNGIFLQQLEGDRAAVPTNGLACREMLLRVGARDTRRARDEEAQKDVRDDSHSTPLNRPGCAGT